MPTTPPTLIHQLLERSAERYPDKIAFIQDGTRVSYTRINTMANALAAELRRRGCHRSTRVVLLLENSLAYVVSYYAILKAGGVAVPLAPSSKPPWLKARLDELDAKIVIAAARQERLLFATDISATSVECLIIHGPKLDWKTQGIRPLPWELLTSGTSCDDPALAMDEDDLACIIYTSGSTGPPKGVMLTHANVVANTRSICRYLSLSAHDVQMVVLPFHYVMGQSLLNTHIACSGTLVINNGFAYPAQVIQQMIDENVTSFSGVPSTYAWLLNKSPLKQKRDKIKALRYCSQAGGHMSAKLKKELRSALPAHTDIVVMYGATEASARLAYLPPDRYTEKMGSIGKAIPGVTLRIIDEKGREVKEGIIGELVASGPNIMQGYWKNPSATEKVLGPQGYHTGDLCWRDKQGYIYLVGRRDNLIKVGGHRINPMEIEDTIMETGIAIETVVLGIEDELLGNRLVAAVVPKERALTPKAVLKACAGLIPRNRLPGEVKLVSSLPKNPSGKVLRKKCLEMFVPTKTTEEERDHA